MSYINVGVSALRAAQVGLNTTAQNISNASTDGYHRQRVDLVDRRTYEAGALALYGGGVDVSQITRLRNATIEQSLTANISGRSAANAQLSTLQQIELALTPGEGSIHSLVTEFFDRVELLATNPGESVLRRQVVSTAEQLADAISQVSAAFSSFSHDVGNQVEAVIETVNDLAGKIAALNRDIRLATARDQTPNTLLDERDRLINELATYVDVDSTSLLNGSDPVIAAGGALIIGEVASVLSAERTANGGFLLTSSTGQRGIDVRGGQLGGLIESAQAVDIGIGADFSEWAGNLIRTVDTIQATGIGLNGPVTTLAGTRHINGVNIPLAEADSLFELESGELTVTVTDAAGQRMTSVIQVDMARDSLEDVVARLDVVNGLNASIVETGTVALHASSGYTFDFAGRPDTQPTTQAISGSARPVVSGTFLGNSNGTWNAEVLSGGEIGVSSDVLVRVTDAATGRVIGDFNFGLGYPASQPVEVADGISLTLAPGTLVAGDAFSMRMTGQPDETGLLASLGLQSLFNGDSLSDLSVAQYISESPANLAASRTGAFGEGRQLDRLIGLRSERRFATGAESVEERLASLTALSGIMVGARQQEIAQRDVKQIQLETARDSVSGVDPNEELLEMLEYQRAFQAASRFVTSIDETLDDLMRLIG